jgi:hypothetical protein
MKDKLIEFLKDQVSDNIGETRPYIDPDNIEWMAEEIVKLFAIPVVSQQRELLKAYADYHMKYRDSSYVDPFNVDKYLESL